MKKILILSREFPPDMGGIGSYAYNLALASLNEGYKVTVITKAETEGIEIDKNIKGVTIVRTPFWGRNNLFNKLSTLLFGAYYLKKELKKIMTSYI
ncbi:hypothetical protein [Alkalicoccobacillus plakortidis]|uniref:Glycosyltransferase subfamily 4-like N-terminal domain-containing protein n=1 Tax=Alkalicoccobacillus plakortidis TaxID=444060 RepID=A0ABT0XL03_9BACI|nr:hypothetical protein [Alkalicoccobacillus plakortidis]MCM2675914.1 hypothetical protein [Alkalicoccobacillus plakortidis]